MIEIRSVKHAEEIEQLTEFFALVFKHKSTPEFWDWKYIKNPSARFMPDVTVAVDNGKIVGARPFLLNEVWFGDNKVIAAQHCDTMVHPDYRRQGIFNRMGRFAIRYLAEHGCALSYGFPGPMSRRGFASQGYRRLMDTEILLRPVNPGEIIAGNLKNNKPGRTLGMIGSRLPFRACRQPLTRTEDYQVEVSDSYTSGLDALASLRKGILIDLVRSEANLRWRFDTHPRNTYRYILARKEGRLQGYAVISRQKQLMGLVAGIIVDYLVKDGDIACFQALISRALEELKRSACHVLAAWAWGEPDLRRELLEGFGFRSSLKFPYHKLIDPGYMDVMLVDERLAATMDIYDKANWRVTYAYPNYT